VKGHQVQVAQAIPFLLFLRYSARIPILSAKPGHFPNLSTHDASDSCDLVKLVIKTRFKNGGLLKDFIILIQVSIS